VRNSDSRQWTQTHAVMLGKPDTGRPIPAEQINAVTMMSSLGCGSSSDSPTRVAIGTRRTAAIVCEILDVNGDRRGLVCTHKVAITSERTEKTARIEYSPKSSTTRSRRLSRSSRRPDDKVALPSAIPPIAKKTMDQ